MILGVASVIVIIVLLFMGGGSPAVNAGKFMEALKQGDSKELSRLSYFENATPAEAEAKWAYTVNKAAPYFRFLCKIGTAREIDKETAVVKIEMMKDVFSPGAYPEPFELPMIKVDGEWKVDVSQMNRKMYPGLPQ
jgi:hypothetical protein